MRAGGYRRPDLTKQQAMVALKRDLASMPDDRLFAATVEGLVHRYRVDRRDLECVLLASQDTRRRFLEQSALVG